MSGTRAITDAQEISDLLGTDIIMAQSSSENGDAEVNNNARTRTNTLRDTDNSRSRSNTLNVNNVLDSVPMEIENNATLGVIPDRLIEVEEHLEEDNNHFVDATRNVDEFNGANVNEIRNDEPSEAKCDEEGFYSVRMTPFIDHSSTHPHMFFGPIIRRLKPGMTLPIGRYTERTRAAATAPSGSSEMVVFKSKVVSRQHAELSVDERGQWFIQDMKSSSGTFVNHVRLSIPNEQSARVALRDSDVVQLGVDYRGGSEDVFRCVRVRLEMNGSWKLIASQFTQHAYQRLKTLVDTDVENKNSSEKDRCSICLDTISQCQALFVSPCSHWWHYGCIRPLLVRSYPHFSCPNCKALCHLEADLEESSR